MDLWDPQTDDFIRSRKDTFQRSGKAMRGEQKLPYSNILFIDYLPSYTTELDLLQYLLPVKPIQIQLGSDGTAHVEILKKADLVGVMERRDKLLKGRKVRLYANKIISDRELIAMAK